MGMNSVNEVYNAHYKWDYYHYVRLSEADLTLLFSISLPVRSWHIDRGQYSETPLFSRIPFTGSDNSS